MKRIVVAAALLAGLSAPQARAGQYTVVTCRIANPAVNNAWVFTGTDDQTVLHADRCASDDGLSVYAALDTAILAGAGDEGWWVFTAPAGTRIVGGGLRRWLHVASDEDWKVEVRLDNVEDPPFEECLITGGPDECSRGDQGGTSGDSFKSLGSIDVGEVRIGGECEPVGGSSCQHGVNVQTMETYLYGAYIFLREDTAPTGVDVDAGGLNDGGWHRGQVPITTTATDAPAGVRLRRLLVGGQERATLTAPGPQDGGCAETGAGVAWTFKTPCEGARGLNGTVTRTVDVTGWPNGAQQLQVVAEDAAGNQAASAPVTVRIDTVAPGAPQVGTSGWTQRDPSYTYTVPAEVNAPIVSGEAKICPPLQACRAEALEIAPGQSRTKAVAGLPEGQTTVTLRYTDAAGNVGVESAPRNLLVDRTAPTVTRVTPSGQAVRAGATLTAALDASDALSGIDRRELEVSIDGGSWAPVTATLTAQEGRSYRFRGRARDRAGNVSDTVTGEPVVASRPPASCGLAIKRVRRRSRGRYAISGTVTKGTSVRVALRAGGRNAVRRDRTTTSGRWSVTLKSPSRRATKLRISASATGCATKRRTVRRASPNGPGSNRHSGRTAVRSGLWGI